MAKDKPTGRPSIYTDELALAICDLIEDGLSLRKICAKDDMPNRASVNKWLNENTAFSDQYARSCKVRRENKFEEMYEIAEKTEEIPRARLLVDVLKWQLSKEEPKKYGDKIDMTSGGEKIETNTIIFKDFRDDSSSK